MRALVNTHARRVTNEGETTAKKTKHGFDVVKGKGQGLIILLHGAPGVGKTSTAECVAAHAGRPLLPITCGDLGGATASEMESNLEKYFDMAREWECVLLLDEADVFLSARERGDIRQIMLASGMFLGNSTQNTKYINHGICVLITKYDSLPSGARILLRYPDTDDEPRGLL